MYFEAARTGTHVELGLTGEWQALQVGALQAALAQVDLTGVQDLRIGTTRLAALDLTGAWELREFVRRARAAGVRVGFDGAPPDQLRLVDETLASAAPAAPALPPVPAIEEGLPEHSPHLVALGRQAVGAGKDLVDACAFLGRSCVTFVRELARPLQLKPIAIARHIYDTGITAVPIVSLIAFLISIIIAYMSARQLIGLGAEIYVVDLLTIGVLRELGVLLTAIIVAGRSGSAFAAELGSMRLNEEIDALEATGVDPFQLLVVPRIIGLALALPLLTIIADIIGLAGGALLCRYLLDMPLTQYAGRVIYAMSPTTFWVGMIKAPVFAFLIALTGCYRGMQVRGSARALGNLVTTAVVQSIFMVILADALFAVLFMEMDI
jgi:phospholipid/cholesterol/gamma-HCH transport system permease protein